MLQRGREIGRKERRKTNREKYVGREENKRSDSECMRGEKK